MPYLRDNLNTMRTVVLPVRGSVPSISETSEFLMLSITLILSDLHYAIPPPQVSYIRLRQQPARFGFFIGGLGINAFLAARVLYTYLT